VNTVFVSVARFLSNLSSTLGVAVWYGWKDRRMDPEELERFYLSLPPDLKQKIWLWLDQPFVEEAYRSGITGKVDELNMTLVTELYSPSMLAAYQNLTKRQMIVTGYWNASSAEEWVDGMRRKLELVRTPGRILGVWIFWDVNDGFGEAYRAYIGGKLRNPVPRRPCLEIVDAAGVDRNSVSVIIPSAQIAPGADLVVGGPVANKRSRAVESYGIRFSRDELIINGTVYRSSWKRVDYGLILYKGNRVYVMGTHRFGTKAALIWLKMGGLAGRSSLLEWVDANGNGDVEADEIRLKARL